MFTHLPSLLRGNKLGFSKEAQEKFKKDTADKLLNQYKGLGDNELLNPLEKAIDLKTCVENRISFGGTSKQSVIKQIEYIKKII